MDSGDLTGLLIVAAIFIGLPWVILHYVTKWKTAPALTRDDETMLEDLYQLARRLEDRMETVERLVAADHPEFRPEFRASSTPSGEEGNPRLGETLRTVFSEVEQFRARNERSRP